MRAGVQVRLLVALLAIAVAAVRQQAGSAFCQSPAETPKQPTRTLADNVYTKSQAERGAEVHDEQCARCHNATTAPHLTDPKFLSRFDGKTLYDVFEVVRQKMPLVRPDSVTPQEKIDVIAYLLSEMHFPAGASELSLDPEELKNIRFQIADPAASTAVMPASGAAAQADPRTLAEAAKTALRTPEEEDALLKADVETITPRPHVPAKYWTELMPEDKAKSLVIARCMLCHDLQRTLAFARPRDQWKGVVDSMTKRGSPVTADEAPRIVDYLTRYYGPDARPKGGVAMQPCKPSEWPKGSSTFRKDWGTGYTLWVSDQQGDHIDIINPTLNRVVERIPCINAPDRTEFSPDGNTAYIPSRSEFNITVVNTRTGAIKAKVPVMARPNVSTLTRDGKQLIIAIWPVDGDEGTKGYLQIMDTRTLKIVQTIEEHGGMHDIWMSHDGTMFLAMPGAAQHVPTGNRYMNAYDTRTKKVLWTCCTNYGPIQMMEMDSTPDGHPNRVFVSDSAFPGFAVLDAKTGKEIGRVAFPTETEGPCAGFKPRASFHGNEISPDGKYLWLATQDATRPCGNVLYRYTLSDLKPAGHIHLLAVDQTGEPYKAPIEGAWVTISPDGKTVYVGRAGRNMVAVVDADTMQEVRRIPTGDYPLHLSIWPRGTP